jgi:hypothetical protein
VVSIYVSGKVGKYAKLALINLQSCKVRFAHAQLALVRNQAGRVNTARSMLTLLLNSIRSGNAKRAASIAADADRRFNKPHQTSQLDAQQ